MPRERDTQGRKIWRGLTRDLAAIGILASLDQHALTRYIQVYQRWCILQQDIETHGETMPVMKQRWIDAHYDDEGHLVPGQHEPYQAGTALRPQVQVWLALSDRLLRMEQQFGMTPSGRAAIGIMLAAAESHTEQPPNPKRFLNLG
jgi:P27 family predicted phage terminase small subunit